MGSQSNNYAYIAGFLDGDGSIMLQLKKRSDSTKGVRFMTTICFYQDSRHDKNLKWIKKILRAGYFSKRNDGMSELRINGFKEVKNILENLSPFIRFKNKQAKLILLALEVLTKKTMRNMTKKDYKKIVSIILNLQKQNYATRKKKTKEDLYRLLDLTP